MIKISYLILFFILSAFSNFAFAQFDKVIVKMQSGAEVRLIDLPWFQFALNISNGQWKDRATTADWIIAAPPSFCPNSNSYKLVWNGDISTFKNQTVNSCSSSQKKKLSGLPKDMENLCDCKIILESNITSPGKGNVIWRSFDDETLLLNEFKFRRTLIGTSGELPIIFSVGNASAGIYNFNGDKICSYNGISSNPDKTSSALNQINSLLRVGDKPIPIVCFDNMHGYIDISKVHYSALRSAIVGDITLNFINGDKYVIKPH